jgi:hypothetical protein
LRAGFVANVESNSANNQGGYDGEIWVEIGHAMLIGLGIFFFLGWVDESTRAAFRPNDQAQPPKPPINKP